MLIAAIAAAIAIGAALAAPSAVLARSHATTPDINHLRGGPGDERVRGTDGPDHIRLGGGDDVVYAGAGPDRIKTGDGADRVFAGPGNDFVFAARNAGVDRIDCGPGRDTVVVDPQDVVVSCERVTVIRPGDTPHLDHVAREIRAMERRTGSDTSEGLLWQVTEGNALPGAGTVAPGWLMRTQDCWGRTTPCDSSGVQQRMLAQIRDTVASAEVLVDISSLSGLADGGFRQAIIDGARQGSQAGRRPLIRMMWGRSPATPLSDGKLRSLQKAVQDAAPGATVVASLMTNTPAFNGYSWNHSKIVAADARVVMSGGINMWSRSYLQSTNPVTDTAVVVRGPAAANAHRFLDVLWQFSCRNEGFGLRYNITIVPRKGGPAGCPGTRAPAPGPAEGTTKVLAVGRAGYIDTGRVTGRTRIQEVSDADRRDSGCFLPPLPNPMNGNAGWDGNNPSDTAIRALVESAYSEVIIGQQEMTFGCATSPSYDVRLFDALARKVRDGVKVTLVVSNPNGAINTSEQYGANPPDTMKVMMKRLTRLMGSRAAASEAACQWLTVAPFRYSPRDTWPGSTPPAHHGKIIAVDGAAFMVGSQNAYPNQLQEFGYIVEDPSAMTDFRRDYLGPMVRFSRADALRCGG